MLEWAQAFKAEANGQLARTCNISSIFSASLVGLIARSSHRNCDRISRVIELSSERGAGIAISSSLCLNKNNPNKNVPTHWGRRQSQEGWGGELCRHLRWVGVRR